MHGLVAEADHAFQVIQGPACIQRAALVTGIGTDRRIAFLKYAKQQRRVDDGTDKPATATEYELAVPRLGQQQLEICLGADNTGHFAVRDRRRLLGHGYQTDIRQRAHGLRAAYGPLHLVRRFDQPAFIICLGARAEQ